MSDLTAYKCLECGHYTITKWDGERCAKCKGQIRPVGNATYINKINNINKSKGLTLNVSIKDFDIFKKVINVVKKFTEDERVPEGIRQGYKDAIIRIDWANSNDETGYFNNNK